MRKRSRYLFVTYVSLFWQKHVLHCKNINLLISKQLNGFNNVLVILQIYDSVKDITNSS